MMQLEVGQIVQARATAVATFGIFLEHQGRSILVEIPETSWIASFASCTEIAAVGYESQVKILREIEAGKRFVGSMTAAHPEGDPWSGNWNLSVGDRVQATVARVVEAADRCGGKRGYLLELRPAALVMLCATGEERLQPGEMCDVEIIEMDVRHRAVKVRLAGPE